MDHFSSKVLLSNRYTFKMFNNFLLILLALLPCISAEIVPESCAEAVWTYNQSGVYQIQLRTMDNMASKPFFVYCELDMDGGDAWTVFQRRQTGDINFNRGWKEYKYGFGSLNKEFWLGLDKLHELTYVSLQELWIQMEDAENNKIWAKYDEFAISNEDQNYTLIVLGNYSSPNDAGDSLWFHEGSQFSTHDTHNDWHKYTCAQKYSGAWWFNDCHARYYICVLSWIGLNIILFKF